MTETRHSAAWLPAAIISLGIAAAGYFVGQTLYNSQVGINTADVKGLAERRVESDRAYWRIQYTVSGEDKNAIPALYEKSKEDQSKIVSVLLASGFDAEEVSPGVVDYNRLEFRDDNQKLVDEKYVLTGSIEVETAKVRQVSAARAKLNELIALGIDIRNNAPSYYFTTLNDIKPEMLKEATTNARLAANEFAANAGVSVGGIRSAVQGGFIIRDVGDNYSDTQKIEKDVRVVTTITFYLTE
ncbi:MAG: SIMPL domain-containing protein [Gammaproteobacteria bacterium]|nr:SIMPL domain-containing protein [Gammaproteobacteria bacterium]MDH5239659.1 SIMPL domain-containing protein [Gammaproteobacteria bacterium]MDH5260098.1 SIMPL domain-containing protein [Gammaproteobacteria bacterium]MDH5582239.1 SIMPL domain-containing protein [Gammaproteobacteria bacterium]